MLRNWVSWGTVGLMLFLTSGCRKSAPDLRPPPGPEVLAVPPPESRYSTSVYPKQAFQDRDTAMIRKIDNAFTPAKGMVGGGGSGINGLR